MKTIQKLLLVAFVVAALVTLTACGARDGVIEGTVSGADPGAAQIQVVIYELERADEVQGVNVFQKGAIVQKALLDETRSFAFTLPPDEYVVQVWLDGLEVADRMIEVRSGRTTTLDLEITPPSS